MTKDIKTVTVVGAGVMGMGIAAHLANAGIKVHLLEMKTETAVKAIERMKNAPPTDAMNAGFMSADSVKRIIPGNSTENFDEAVKDSDWVIEVIPEKLEWKRDLYKRIDAVRKPGTIVSSNTSSIPLRDLVEGFPDDFRQNFAITHFFNPPRHQRLLELVGGKDTDRDVIKTLHNLCDVKLGKHVIECNDTPCFIGNRIGTYFTFRAMEEALKKNLKVEEVDAVFSKPFHMPPTGVFGMVDAVGLSLVPNLIHDMDRTLPADDAFRKIDGAEAMKVVQDMLAQGRGGRATPNGGFYRPKKDESGKTVKDADGKTVLQAINLKTGEYHDSGKIRTPALKPDRQKGVRAVFEAKDSNGKPDRLGDYAWNVMRDTLLYTISLIPEVSEDICDFDAAMREGYRWEKGPFELIDEMGVEWFTNRLRKDGIDVPKVLELADGRDFYKTIGGKPHHMTFDFTSESTEYKADRRPEGVLKLSDVKTACNNDPVLGNDSASVWDIGDGVLCFEFHSKGNTIDPSTLYLLNKTVKLIESDKKAFKPEEKKFKALVIYNEGEHFSLGANIGVVSKGLEAARHEYAKKAHISAKIEKNVFDFVDNMVHYGQAVYRSLRESSFPVVGAPHGMALGGGCEILLHCDSVQAAGETYTGLVESGVGVIPGWGGCARMLERFQKAAAVNSPAPGIRQAFMNIMVPPVSSSARDAQKKLWLRPEDSISMNRDRVLADAKAKALALVPGYTPPKPGTFRLPGEHLKATLDMGVDSMYIAGKATHHDAVVGDALATVLTGGNTNIGITLTDDDIRHLERESFMSLVKTEGSQARIASMVNKNKVLREEPLKEPKTLDDIRAARTPLSLPRRPFADGPLTGADEEKLFEMAQDTEEALRLAKDGISEAKRHPVAVAKLLYRFILK